MLQVCGKHNICYSINISYTMRCATLILIFYLSAIYARPQVQQNLKDVDSNSFAKDSTKVTVIPFYGGAKGQSLLITESTDGTVLSTEIIKMPEKVPLPTNDSKIDLASYDNIYSEEHNEYIENIQRTAAELVRLQQVAKQFGSLNEEEEKLYQMLLMSINTSASKLANLQESSSLDVENRDYLSHWFEGKRDSIKDKKQKKDEKLNKESKNNAKVKENEKNKEESKIKEENNIKEESKIKEDVQQTNDSVPYLPPDEPSIAEAKPVGIAVAGNGGVAASKPIATAIVGPAGLAVARPVATAVAGVFPNKSSIPTYVEGLVLGPHKKS